MIPKLPMTNPTSGMFTKRSNLWTIKQRMKQEGNLLLWRILHQKKLKRQLEAERKQEQLRKELRTELAFRSQAKSVNLDMGLLDKDFQVVLLHRRFGAVLSLDQTGLNSSQRFQGEHLAVAVVDGSYTQLFAEFSLN
jgi:hypothetical protein